MNKIYNIVWNKTLGQWVVAAEDARSHSKGGLRATAAITLLTSSVLFQGAVFAANECGPATAGSTITCTTANYVPTASGTISYAPINGVTLNVTGITLATPSTNNNQQGILVSTGGNTPFSNDFNIISSGNTITTGSAATIGQNTNVAVGNSSDGLRVQNRGTGNSSITMTSGAITTYGFNAHGIDTWQRGANANNTANVSATMYSGTVATSGRYSHGVYARSDTGQGLVSVTLNGGTINTYGSDSVGVAARNSAGVTGASGNTVITMNGGTVNTSGYESYGLWVDHATTGTATATVMSGTITTQGLRAHGVLVESTVGDASVTSAGTISTNGDSAEGIYAISSGTGVTVLATQTGGSITTKGINADAVVAYADGATTTTGVKAVATQSGGSIVTTGGSTTVPFIGTPVNGSSGLVAQVGTVSSLGVPSGGTGEAQAIQSGGSISTSGILGYGILAMNAGTGNAIVTQTAGTVATTGELAQGIYASAETGSVTVDSAGTVSTTGKSATGILALASNGVTINQTGSITTTGVGQSSHMPTIMALLGYSAADTGNADGILAFSDADVTVNSANINASGDGIDANAKNTGNIKITTKGTLTAGEEGIDAYSAGGNIEIVNNAILTANGTGSTGTLSGIIATADVGTAIITNTDSIISTAGDGINVANVVGGSTIKNSGDITATTAGKFVIAGGDAVETVTTTAGTLTGNTDLGAGNDSFTASGGALVGSTFMGSDDDAANLTGTVDVTKAPQFDGGTGTDVLNIDGLTMNGFTAASNDATGNNLSLGSNITAFETINLQNGANFTLTDNLDVSTLNPAGTKGQVNIDEASRLNIAGMAGAAVTRTINGDLNNAGLLYFNNLNTTTTITGNYTGVAGSTVNLETYLADDSSATDKLQVTGDTSGTSALVVRPVAGSPGAQTNVGIKVIDVVGASNAAFSLASPAQAGAYEYVLKKDGNGGDAGDWYLVSTYDCTLNASCPIYRPAVAVYVAAQTANDDAAFGQMSTLHQRMGEQRDLATDKPQTWGRIIANGVNNDGHNRFNYEQTTAGFQFGHDILYKTSSIGTQQRAGVTAQYTHSNMSATDSVRASVGLNEDAGSMQSNSVGLGGYYTRMTTDGTYLDVVGQVNRVSNKFSDSYGGQSKQNGWQVGLSGEVGKVVAEVKGWKIEPQAQLNYLFNKRSDFSDLYSNVSIGNSHQLRARLGLRVHKDVKNCDNDAQYYTLLNVGHDFLNSNDITLTNRSGVGSVNVDESFDRTYGEIGAGIQGQVAKTTFLYADARYQQSFKGNKNGASFNFGVKFNF